MGKLCVLVLVVSLTAAVQGDYVPDKQPLKVKPSCSADKDKSPCIDSLFPSLDKHSMAFPPQEIDRIARNFSFAISPGLTSTAELLPNNVYICFNASSNITGSSPINDSIITIVPQLEMVTTLLSSIGRSCKQLFTTYPNAQSGYYELLLPNGSYSSVYCDMQGTQCDGQGGWMRVGYFDMTQPNARCPKSLDYHQYSNIDHGLCVRYGGAGCRSIFYDTLGYNFTAVCGRARAYQFGSPDGYNYYSSINEAYVDGLSITYGNPRTHIWTYVNGHKEEGTSGINCPCNQGSTQNIPSFVGYYNYYCESGLPASQSWQPILYATDPLWDGQNCLSDESPCCTVSKMPWFLKSLNGVVNDYIELRLCGNQVTWDEDTPIELFEVYVK